MKMRTILRIRADLRNQGYDLPDWVYKTSDHCYYPPNGDWYLPYRGWKIDPHTKFSYVPVFLDDFPYLPWSPSFFCSTLSSPKNTKFSHPSQSLHAMIMIYHRVQHTSSTASSQIDSLPLQASFLHPGGVSAAVAPPSKSTASKYTSNVARSYPASASSTSLNHGLSVHLWVHSISVSYYISNLARSRPQRASPNLLDHGLPVHLQTHSITASKCISEFTRSRTPSTSPNWLDHGLGVYLWVHSILLSKCISHLARSQPPSTSQMSDCGCTEIQG